MQLCSVITRMGEADCFEPPFEVYVVIFSEIAFLGNTKNANISYFT
jgi:hypothetical protein